MNGLRVLRLVTIIALVGSTPVNKRRSRMSLRKISEQLASLTESVSHLETLTDNKGDADNIDNRNVTEQISMFSEQLAQIRQSVQVQGAAHLIEIRNNNNAIKNLLDRLVATNNSFAKYESDIQTNKNVIDKLLKRLDSTLIPVTDAMKKFQADNAEIKKDISSMETILERLQWIRNGNSYYFIVHERLAWHAAKLHCETIGGYLVEVDNQEENDYILSLIKTDRVLVKGVDVWLGGNDEQNEGTWEWSRDQRPIDFTNWMISADEPNNMNGDEHCLTIYAYFYRRDAGLWNDDWCKKEKPFICEANEL